MVTVAGGFVRSTHVGTVEPAEPSRTGAAGVPAVVRPGVPYALG